MLNAVTFETLNKEAADRGYKLTFNKTTGRPRMIPPASGRSPEFERRLKANSAVLETHYTTPAVIKDRVKDASRDGWVSSVNNYLNHIRDSYVEPGAEFAGRLIGGQPMGGIGLPSDEGAAVGGDIAKTGVQTAIPNSITGKAVGLSMLANPESLVARMAIPAITGGAVGEMSGEGGLGGTAQGLLAGAGGEIPTALQVPGKVNRFFKRSELTKQLYDDVVPGQHLNSILRLKSFDGLLSKGQNWVRALRDGRTGQEAGQRLMEGMDNLQESILSHSLEKAKGIQKNFMDKLKVPFNPRGHGYSKELFDAYKAAREEAAQALSEGRQLVNAMKKTRRLRSQVYGPGGKMKQGPIATDAKEALSQTTSAIKSKLKTFSPAFADTYDALNDEYALFASVRDLADNPKAITQDGRHVNLDTVMRQMDEVPRQLQGRMKQEWDSMKDIMRRGAPTSEGFDQPGFASRVRTMMYGIKGHAAASADVLGDVAAGKPLVTKPVGKVPGLLPKQPKLQPGLVPRLITGGAVNDAIDQEAR